MSYFWMRHMIIFTFPICHSIFLTYLSRMYCDKGAKLNVPKPLPQRQMPMARALLVVK